DAVLDARYPGERRCRRHAVALPGGVGLPDRGARRAGAVVASVLRSLVRADERRAAGPRDPGRPLRRAGRGERDVVHDGEAMVPGGGEAPMRTAARVLRPRRRPPRMVRSRLRRTRRPPSAPRRKRRWREALAVLIAALLLWIFWPAPAPPADDPL